MTARPTSRKETAAEVVLWLWVIGAFAAYGYQFVDLMPDVLRVLGLDI